MYDDYVNNSYRLLMKAGALCPSPVGCADSPLREGAVFASLSEGGGTPQA